MITRSHKMILNLMMMMKMDKCVQEDNNDMPNNESFVHHILIKNLKKYIIVMINENPEYLIFSYTNSHIR